MKKAGIIVVTILIILITGCSTTTMAPLQTAPEYSEVVYVYGLGADEIFTRVNLFYVSAFKNPESVIEYSDKDAGVVAGKYATEMKNPGALEEVLLFSILTVEVKDGKYRVSFNEPYQESRSLVWPLKKYTYRITSQKQFEIVLSHWEDLATQLRGYVQQDDDSDW